ncbi:MAG: hypothetical protein IJW45_08400 [Oscillospiraceae bacterium]|nr:hypothetical protein [Oscillospiraceae bacterium]
MNENKGFAVDLVHQIHGGDAEDRVEIRLVKEAGSREYQRHISAEPGAAALTGVAVLILDLAREMKVSVDEVLGILAVLLWKRSERGDANGGDDV